MYNGHSNQRSNIFKDMLPPRSEKADANKRIENAAADNIGPSWDIVNEQLLSSGYSF
jgi:hypothetical protein